MAWTDCAEVPHVQGGDASNTEALGAGDHRGIHGAER
jgi:hypothetical protein